MTYELAITKLVQEGQKLDAQLLPVLKQIDALKRKEPSGERADLGLHLAVRDGLTTARRWSAKVATHPNPIKVVEGLYDGWSTVSYHLANLLRWMKQQDPEMYARFGATCTRLLTPASVLGRRAQMLVALLRGGNNKLRQRVAREESVLETAMDIIHQSGGPRLNAYENLRQSDLFDISIALGSLSNSRPDAGWGKVLQSVSVVLSKMQADRTSIPRELLAAQSKIIRLLQGMIPRLRKYMAE